MAPAAIAANQFAEAGDNLPAASIATVNFKKEMKGWDKDSRYTEVNPENANLIGANAFSGTGVGAVNFLAPISVKNAIVAESADESPFGGNSSAMTIDFKAGVIANGIGQYAFANTAAPSTTIKLDNAATYATEAFGAHSFDQVSYQKGNPSVTVMFTDPSVRPYRAFAQDAFYPTTTETRMLT